MTSLRPAADRVIVELNQPEETYANGIIIPQAAQKPSDTATVIAVHADSKSGIEVGNTVLLTSSYAGANLTDPADGKEYVAVLEDEILAILG